MRRIVFLVLTLLLYNRALACPEYCSCDVEEEWVCRGAELVTVPDDLINDAVTLLDLSYNNISNINNQAFVNLPGLKTIILSDNGIEEIQPEAFLGLVEVEKIDLRNNFIEDIHPSTFQESVNLISLDLSDNKFQQFQLHINSPLTSLNLSGNQLNSEGISGLADLTLLESLDLSHNQIQTLHDDLFGEMIKISFLDFSDNPLEYDCRLRTLRTLCSSKNINCVIDDEESWTMLDNLNCDDEGTEAPAEEDGYSSDGNAGDENGGSEVTSVGSDGDENEMTSEGEGSGEIAATEVILDDVEAVTDDEIEAESEGDWIMIVIIGAVAGSVLLFIVIVATICVLRRRKFRDGSSGNISRTHSIEYLNHEDQFTKSYKNSRTESGRKVDKVRNNNYDRVVILPDYTRDVLRLGDNASAEIVRVPSFKTHGIATPLNLPEEVPGMGSSHSLRHPSPSNNSRRASSLGRQVLPDIQVSVPSLRRVPSNTRR